MMLEEENLAKKRTLRVIIRMAEFLAAGQPCKSYTLTYSKCKREKFR